MKTLTTADTTGINAGTGIGETVTAGARLAKGGIGHGAIRCLDDRGQANAARIQDEARSRDTIASLAAEIGWGIRSMAVTTGIQEETGIGHA